MADLALAHGYITLGDHDDVRVEWCARCGAAHRTDLATDRRHHFAQTQRLAHEDTQLDTWAEGVPNEPPCQERHSLAVSARLKATGGAVLPLTLLPHVEEGAIAMLERGSAAGLTPGELAMAALILSAKCAAKVAIPAFTFLKQCRRVWANRDTLFPHEILTTDEVFR